MVPCPRCDRPVSQVQFVEPSSVLYHHAAPNSDPCRQDFPTREARTKALAAVVPDTWITDPAY